MGEGSVMEWSITLYLVCLVSLYGIVTFGERGRIGWAITCYILMIGSGLLAVGLLNAL